MPLFAGVWEVVVFDVVGCGSTGQQCPVEFFASLSVEAAAKTTDLHDVAELPTPALHLRACWPWLEAATNHSPHAHVSDLPCQPLCKENYQPLNSVCCIVTQESNTLQLRQQAMIFVVAVMTFVPLQLYLRMLARAYN